MPSMFRVICRESKPRMFTCVSPRWPSVTGVTPGRSPSASPTLSAPRSSICCCVTTLLLVPPGAGLDTAGACTSTSPSWNTGCAACGVCAAALAACRAASSGRSGINEGRTGCSGRRRRAGRERGIRVSNKK